MKLTTHDLIEKYIAHITHVNTYDLDLSEYRIIKDRIEVIYSISDTVLTTYVDMLDYITFVFNLTEK